MEPFIGEIILFAGTYAPVGWAFCDGSALSGSQYPALYALIGTTYGTDGSPSGFRLPDLRGRVPVHRGSLNGDTYALGAAGGQQAVTLSTSQLPPHTHAFRAASGGGTQTSPTQGYPSQGLAYGTTASGTMASDSVSPTGGGLPVSVMQPYLTVSYIIALEGVFPTSS